MPTLPRSGSGYLPISSELSLRNATPASRLDLPKISTVCVPAGRLACAPVTVCMAPRVSGSQNESLHVAGGRLTISSSTWMSTAHVVARRASAVYQMVNLPLPLKVTESAPEVVSGMKL